MQESVTNKSSSMTPGSGIRNGVVREFKALESEFEKFKQEIHSASQKIRNNFNHSIEEIELRRRSAEQRVNNFLDAGKLSSDDIRATAKLSVESLKEAIDSVSNRFRDAMKKNNIQGDKSHDA